MSASNPQDLKWTLNTILKIKLNFRTIRYKAFKKIFDMYQMIMNACDFVHKLDTSNEFCRTMINLTSCSLSCYRNTCTCAVYYPIRPGLTCVSCTYSEISANHLYSFVPSLVILMIFMRCLPFSIYNTDYLHFFPFQQLI